jgi:O-antigen ligase
MLEAVNRNFFPIVFDKVIKNITFFGAGQPLIEIRNGLYRQFHNLYLTLIYHRGVIGAILFLFILFYSLINLIKSYQKQLSQNHKLLTVSCIISFLVFFINEFKFEFTRHASYQQICWALFALFQLIALQNKLNYTKILKPKL